MEPTPVTFVILAVVLVGMPVLWITIVLLMSAISPRNSTGHRDRSAQSIEPLAFGCVGLVTATFVAFIYLSTGRDEGHLSLSLPDGMLKAIIRSTPTPRPNLPEKSPAP